MPDFSIVIPHRGSTLGLWATIHSIEEELKSSAFVYEYIVVVNGEDPINLDTKQLIRFLTASGKLKEVIHKSEPLSPPAARQLGSEVASGDIVFFFDNHCLVAKDYFARAMKDFEHYGMDMLHSTTQFFLSDNVHYHYKLKLDHNFWAESCMLPQHNLKPYKCAAAGHGGFAVQAKAWKDVGGYGPLNLFTGYGGEEIYTDFKFWLLGKTVWIDPRVIHYHYAGARGYARHYSDDYYRNLLISANVIGGNDWMYKVFKSFSEPGKFMRTSDKTPLYDLLIEAEARSRAHAAELATRRSKSLDELLLWFDAEVIPGR